MAVVGKTGNVKSCTKTGAAGTTRQVVMTFPDPPPTVDVVFDDVPESYYADLLAAKLANPPAPVAMTYEDTTNTIQGTTI